MGLLDRKTEHHLGCKINEVYLQNLAHEGERTRRAEVTLDYLDVVVLGQKLDVEGARDVEGLGDAARYFFDPAHGLDIQLLGRELDCGVARVYAGELDVFRDRVGLDFTVLCNSVHLNLLRVLDKLGDNDRMLLGDVGGKTEEAFELLGVRADVHRRAREDVAGTDENREADFVDELVDVGHRGQLAPAGLVDSEFVEH